MTFIWRSYLRQTQQMAKWRRIIRRSRQEYWLISPRASRVVTSLQLKGLIMESPSPLFLNALAQFIPGAKQNHSQMSDGYAENITHGLGGFVLNFPEKKGHPLLRGENLEAFFQ